MTDTRLVLGLDGMTCTNCSNTIENLLSGLNGVTLAKVSLSTQTAMVEINSKVITSQFICDEVESIGFGCELLHTTEITLKLDGDIENNQKNSKIISTTKHFVLCLENNITDSQLNILQHNIRELDGILDVSITGIGNKKAFQISLDDSKIGPRHIVKAVQQQQQQLHLSLNISIHSHGGFMMANRLKEQYSHEINRQGCEAIVASILTIPVLVISHLVSSNSPLIKVLMTKVVNGLDTCGLILFLLSTPVQWYVGYRFHKKAVLSIHSGTLGMDFLISTGTTAAYLFSFIALIAGMVTGKPNDVDAAYFETSAVLITVVVIGKFLETYARGITASAIHNLSTRRARYAHIVNDRNEQMIAQSQGLWIGPQVSLSHHINNNINNSSSGSSSSSNHTNTSTSISTSGIQTISVDDEEVDASLVHRGDCIRLVTGEVIPADGILFSGTVGVDESMLTGESALVIKTNEALVYGGTVVVEGSALMIVTACGDDSTLGKIVTTVQEAQSSKPPIQEKADMIARYFVPFVASVSALTFLVWMICWSCGWVPQEWYNKSTTMTAPHTKHHMGDSTSASRTGNPILFAFFFALSVWVSACPCAFGLATPTAILVATGVAAKCGILIRKGAALQHTAEIKTIAFDKTGTLTLGKPCVSDFYITLNQNGNQNGNGNRVTEIGGSGTGIIRLPIDERIADIIESIHYEKDQLGILIWILQRAEIKSSHPLATGIVDFCRKRLSDLQFHPKYNIEDEKFDVIAGQGISMLISTKSSNPLIKLLETRFSIVQSINGSEGGNIEVLVGNHSFLVSKGVIIPTIAMSTANNLRSGGKIAVFMSISSHLVAIIGLSDTIRPEAPIVLSYLRNQGIKCYMVTGDDWNTALAIGSMLGIEAKHIYANAKPHDKGNFVRALQEYHDPYSGTVITQKCLFIGDGTNDSEAMARSSVGVAMAGGTDIAIEAGDVVFCKNSLQALVTLISLSKATMGRIWMNFCWAFGYNIILIPIAAGVFYPVSQLALAPMMAGMAMAFSSISIVISSLLLGLFQPPSIHDTNSSHSSNNISTFMSTSRSRNSVHSSDIISSGVELREFSAEDPLNCNCPISLPSSPRTSISLPQNKDRTISNRRLEYENTYMASFQIMISRIWRMISYDVEYEGLRMTDDMNIDRTKKQYDTYDDSAVVNILSRMKAYETSVKPSIDSPTSTSKQMIINPLSSLQSTCYGKSRTIEDGYTDGTEQDGLYAIDCGCGCGCGRINCRCPPNCGCKSYQVS